MKTFPALLVFAVVLAAVSGSQGSLFRSKTFVTNWSTRQIRTTIAFGPGDNEFRDRLIDPYTWQSTEYWTSSLPINIEIWIEGSPSHGSTRVSQDRSVVAYDDGPNIDIYLAKYGKLTEIDGDQLEKLTTIYPW